MATRFQPSSYSPTSYGAAETTWVDVRDVPGDTFRVYSDGLIELVRSGTTWKPGSSTYDQIVANLADVPGNEAKMASVLGASNVSTYIARAPGQTGTSYQSSSIGVSPGAGAADFVEKKKLTDYWFFWPLVVGNSIAVIGGLTYYFRATESGKEQWAKLTGQPHSPRRRNPAAHLVQQKTIELPAEDGGEPIVCIVKVFES